METLKQIFEILGSLGIFFYGMKIMSEAIQRRSGERLRTSLNFMTRHRYGGLLTGFFVTCIIQSSSATTVMVVSFVNAGLLTLAQSIGVIMGANLGTTLTIWIVSLLGFKFKMSAVTLPILACGIPFIFSKNPKWKDVGEIMIGFALLFLGLSMLKNAVPDIKNNPEVMEFLKHYTDMGFASLIIFVIVGVLLTVVVQSSSAAGAITVTMAYKGWIDFPTAAAIVLGENSGTTITAYLAALAGNVNAKRAARAHLDFNVAGTVGMLAIFSLFLSTIDRLIPGSVTDPTHIPVHLSAFHTLFNLCNIGLLIWFVPQIARLVERIVKVNPEEVNEEYKLEYITTGVMRTPEMSLLEARKEIKAMSGVVADMFSTFLNVFFNPDKKMGKVVDKLKKQENLTDRMQEEISNFLIETSKENLNEVSANRVNARLKIVNEIESMADCVYNLILVAQKKYDKKMVLHPTADSEIRSFADQVIKFMQFNHDRLEKTNFSDEDLEIAYKYENAIDQTRADMRKSSISRLQTEDGHVKAEMLYMDILKNFERMGDYALNVSQSLSQMNTKE